MELEPIDVGYAKKLAELGRGPVPTKRQYVAALQQLRATMSDSARGMLRWHSKAPAATATAEEIALACGHSGFRATNSIYGSFATNLRRVIGGPFAKAGPEEMQLSIVVTVIRKRPPEHLNARLQMHEPFVAALEELQWS